MIEVAALAFYGSLLVAGLLLRAFRPRTSVGYDMWAPLRELERIAAAIPSVDLGAGTLSPPHGLVISARPRPRDSYNGSNTVLRELWRPPLNGSNTVAR